MLHTWLLVPRLASSIHSTVSLLRKAAQHLPKGLPVGPTEVFTDFQFLKSLSVWSNVFSYSHGFTWTQKHYRCKRLGGLLCAGKQLPQHIRSTLRKERAGHTLLTWNTDLTIHCWECLAPGGLDRVSDIHMRYPHSSQLKEPMRECKRTDILRFGTLMRPCYYQTWEADPTHGEVQPGQFTTGWQHIRASERLQWSSWKILTFW